MDSSGFPPLRRTRLIVLSLLLVFSTACILTGRRPAPDATPEATSGVSGAASTATSQPAAVKVFRNEKLPPVLVETAPAVGSRIAPRQPVTFYFSREMERMTVESAFAGSPAPSGAFTWLDDATMQFTPDQPLDPGTQVTYTLSLDAKAANGENLAAPVSVVFKVAEKARIVQRLPLPDAAEASPASVVSVSFSDSMVELGAAPSSLPQPFELDPPVEGRGEWINTSTFAFYPQPSLQGGTGYTVRVNPDLQSSYGTPLDDESLEPWSFNTSLPQVAQYDGGSHESTWLDQKFTITFNQPMNNRSVENSLHLRGPDGQDAAVKTFWDAQNTILTIEPQPLLQHSSAYTLSIESGAQGIGGSPLAQPFSQSFLTVDPLRLVDPDPPSSETFYAYNGFGSFALVFNAPLQKGQDFSKLIQVEPRPASLSTNYYDDNRLYISGTFEPSTAYRVSVDESLKDRWGGTLSQPDSLVMVSNPIVPELTILSAGSSSAVLFILPTQNTIPAQAANLRTINLETGSMDTETAIGQLSYTLEDPAASLVPETRWTIPAGGEPDKLNRIDLPVTPDGSALPTGLFFLRATSPQLDSNNYYTSIYTIISSQINLLMKIGRGNATVWAIDTPYMQPARGLEVQFYNDKAAPAGSCVTGEDGVCSSPLEGFTDDYSFWYAQAGAPGQPDFAFASSSMSQGMQNWQSWGTAPGLSKGLLTYLYTDRPLYRPGQEVFLKLIMRSVNDARYTLPSMDRVEVMVHPPYNFRLGEDGDLPLTSLRLSLDANGSASGSFILPEGSEPGMYSITIPELPDYQGIFFQVAEYRKPDFAVQVNLTKTDYLPGEELNAEIQTSYYFGAPAGNLSLNWTLASKYASPHSPDGWRIGPYDMRWLNYGMYLPEEYAFFVVSGQAVTAPDGKFRLTIPAEQLESLDTTVTQELTLEVTASDQSQAGITGRAKATLHPSPYYIKVNPETWNGVAKEELAYSVHTVDWQFQPSGNRELVARFNRVEWERSDPPAMIGDPVYTKKATPVASTNLRTDGLGRARVSFIPEEPGTYEIVLTSGDGALTSLLAWVGGPGSARWPQLSDHRINIEADTASYKPGDTARLRFNNPFPAGAQTLLTVEREQVITHYTSLVEGSLAVLDLPISELYAPNVFASIVIVGDNDQGQPDFRQGQVKLLVDSSKLLLDVQAVPQPNSSAPGQPIRVMVKVTDSDGAPVEGEFSFALVDKALLAMTTPNSPAIEDAFYGNQPNRVLSAMDMAVSTLRIVPRPAGRGGAGGDSQMAVEGERVNFQDTALWLPKVKTDLQGKAEISVTLPDNLTTWRGDLRLIDKESRVGSASLELVVSRPLLVRPVVPRFLTAGDHFQFGAVVHNNTGQEIDTTVELDAVGLKIDAQSPALQQAAIPAHGSTRVDWWVTVTASDAVDPLFRVEGGGFRDDTRLETGPLRVLTPAVPFTFATSGVLAEEGERKEIVALPRSFTPSDAVLRVEISPSLAAIVMDGIKVQESWDEDITESLVSKLFSNLAAYQAVTSLGLKSPDLGNSLKGEIATQVRQLASRQNDDGGFGWRADGLESQPYLSAYALLALQQASQQGFLSDTSILERVANYLEAGFSTVTFNSSDDERDLLAFTSYAVASFRQNNSPSLEFAAGSLYAVREAVSPWSKALLALTFQTIGTSPQAVQTLISDITSTARRSATGAWWEAPSPSASCWSSQIFSTAVVTHALARLDPAQPLLSEALRYLALNRNPNGLYQSTYETAWVFHALSQALKASGDLQADYHFEVSLNDRIIATGEPSESGAALRPVLTEVPYSGLLAEGGNELIIRRGPGSGQLYYRVYLDASRPAVDIPAIDRGMRVFREYFLTGQDCGNGDCQPVQTAQLGDQEPLQVRLTLSLANPMYFVEVRDFFPAGMEAIDPSLLTSQRLEVLPQDAQAAEIGLLRPFDPGSGFGFGFWFFQPARISDSGIRWQADYLPAGTYQLTYRLVPAIAGEFNVLPARAWERYFPEVYGSSSGSRFTVQP